MMTNKDKRIELCADGIRICVLPFGATLQSLVVNDAGGKPTDVVLGNTVATRFYFTASDASRLSIDVTIGNYTETFDEFVSMGGGKYYLDFFGIEATQFDNTVSATFYVDGVQTGRTINYSVNAYICGTQNTSNGTLQALVRALYNYGASAAAYAAA